VVLKTEIYKLLSQNACVCDAMEAEKHAAMFSQLTLQLNSDLINRLCTSLFFLKAK